MEPGVNLVLLCLEYYLWDSSESALIDVDVAPVRHFEGGPCTEVGCEWDTY
jgi:hypothetical protein